MKKLARYLRHFKKEVILGPFFKLLEAIFELIVPLVMAKIIDVGVKNGDTQYVLIMGGVMVVLGIAGLGFALICQYFAARASQGVGTLLRNDLFAHILSFSHGEVDRFGTHSLITRITNDVNQIQLAVAMLIRLVVRAPFLVIGAAVMAMMLDLQLSLVFLAAAPLVALALYFVMSRSIPFYRVIQKKLDRISLSTRENLEGARVIRAFSKQEAEQKRFEQATEDAMDSSVRVGKISALLNPLTFAIMNIAIVAIIWFGGLRVNAGSLSQGQIIAFVNYMTQILLALVVVANLVVIFTKASASAARINEVLEPQPAIADRAQDRMPAPYHGPKIQFQDVSFSYPDAEEASLSHISAEMLSGQTIGIIGGTGSGKSTLVSLIPRFYDATSGQVLVDGMDLLQNSRECKRLIGYLPEKPPLYDEMTVRAYLRFVCELKEVQKSAIAAHVEDIIRTCGLSEVAHRLIGHLSKGYRQRVGVAQSLCGNPKVLVLDEPTVGLDPRQVVEIRALIADLGKTHTVIFSSHLLSEIQQLCQRVLILNRGHLEYEADMQELAETGETLILPIGAAISNPFCRPPDPAKRHQRRIFRTPGERRYSR